MEQVGSSPPAPAGRRSHPARAQPIPDLDRWTSAAMLSLRPACLSALAGLLLAAAAGPDGVAPSAPRASATGTAPGLTRPGRAPPRAGPRHRALPPGGGRGGAGACGPPARPALTPGLT